MLLSDINTARMDGMELLRRVRGATEPPKSSCSRVTPRSRRPSRREARRLRLSNEPYHITEIDDLVKQAAEKRRLRVDNQRLRQQLARQSEMPEIISVSDAMREALRSSRRVAPSEASVEYGQSGREELIAHAIHRLSNGATLHSSTSLRRIQGIAPRIRAFRLRSGRVLRRERSQSWD